MEMILFAFFGFVLGLIVGASVAGIVANSINDKILESSNELCESCGKTLIAAISFYGILSAGLLIAVEDVVERR